MLSDIDDLKLLILDNGVYSAPIHNNIKHVSAYMPKLIYNWRNQGVPSLIHNIIVNRDIIIRHYGKIYFSLLSDMFVISSHGIYRYAWPDTLVTIYNFDSIPPFLYQKIFDLVISYTRCMYCHYKRGKNE